MAVVFGAFGAIIWWLFARTMAADKVTKFVMTPSGSESTFPDLTLPTRLTLYILVVLPLLAAVLQFQTLLGVALVGAVYAVGQAVESMYITPRLLGERIGLHPIEDHPPAKRRHDHVQEHKIRRLFCHYVECLHAIIGFQKPV